MVSVSIDCTCGRIQQFRYLFCGLTLINKICYLNCCGSELKTYFGKFAQQRRNNFRGCSHSLMFRLPCSMDLQVAPTAEAQVFRAARPFTPRIARLVTCPEMWQLYVSDMVGLSPTGLQPCRPLRRPGIFYLKIANSLDYGYIDDYNK